MGAKLNRYGQSVGVNGKSITAGVDVDELELELEGIRSASHVAWGPKGISRDRA